MGDEARFGFLKSQMALERRVKHMVLNSQHIGNLIKSQRKRADLTQNELADRIGVSKKAVSKWEQGRGIPDISLLYQLSKVLDMDIESILAGNLDDAGKEWAGVIYLGETEGGLVSGRRDLEYFISMFLLVGIRDIAVVSSDSRRREDEKLLKEYQEKGFLKEIWCESSMIEIIQNTTIRKRHVCFLYQAAFLYGMHLTRYIRRAMLRDKITVLALRQGTDSVMPEICFNDGFLCVEPKGGEASHSEWRIFPMIFGHGKYVAGYMEWIECFKDREKHKIDAGTLRAYFKEVYVEPMERGMLAFSMGTESERMLAEQVLSGIEKTQHIRIGDLEEIMAVRGWR